MKITYLDEAETIVESADSLFWIGWDIGCMVPDPTAEYDPSGIFDKATSTWCRLNVYPLGCEGWTIPDSVVKT